MKGRMKTDQANTKRVFAELDHCVTEARKAEASGNWMTAWQEADKLNLLCNCSYASQIAANSAGVMVGVHRLDWVMVAISAATLFGLVVVIISKRMKK